MAAKRNHDGLDPVHDRELVAKRAKKGFTVGPANLPDGTYRRKGIQALRVVLPGANIPLQQRRSRRASYTRPKLKSPMPRSRSVNKQTVHRLSIHMPPPNEPQAQPTSCTRNDRPCSTRILIRQRTIHNSMLKDPAGHQDDPDPVRSSGSLDWQSRSVKKLEPDNWSSSRASKNAKRRPKSGRGCAQQWQKRENRIGMANVNWEGRARCC